MYRLTNIEEAGQALRAHREALGMTQAQLAEASGITRARLSLLERGLANVSLSSYLRLVQALGAMLVVEPATERPTLIQLRRASGQGGA